MMKLLAALSLALVICLPLVGCSTGEKYSTEIKKTEEDIAQEKANSVGQTPPMGVDPKSGATAPAGSGG